MMIIHIALFSWKNGTTKEEIDSIFESIRQLKNKCTGISNIFCGENYHKESKGLTHGVVVLADSQKALDDYRKHPDHKIIAEKIEIIEDDSLGFDFCAKVLKDEDT